MELDLESINKKASKEGQLLAKLQTEINKVVVGQSYMIERLLIALICNNHVLIEGLPGLAKTLTITSLAKSLKIDFKRIQFTPDLLPADIIGTLIYNPKSGEFTPKQGPVFSNIVLADEINRAPAKVQSALLESMQERQVTIGDETYNLDDPFMVLATQNPVEQEGTYPLPEAQVDRFMLKLNVQYPEKHEELEILRRMAKDKPALDIKPVFKSQDILRLRKLVDDIYMDPKLEEYIINLIDCTRNPKAYGLDINNLILYGASPRASIYLSRASKAHALLNERGWVTPQDIKDMALDVLRHRIIVSYEAEAEGVTSEKIIEDILNKVDVP